MSTGPLGGPRPFSDCKLQYNVLIIGPTEIAREENSPFDKTSGRSTLDKIGLVLMAVNKLSYPSKYEIEEFEIFDQGPGSGLSENETRWSVTYTLTGPALAKSISRITSASDMRDAHEVMINRNNEPIKNAQAIRSFNIDERLEVDGIQITCG